MEEMSIHEIKQYVGFDDEDADRLRALGKVLQPAFDEITDQFCRRVSQNAVAAGVLSESGADTARFQRTLRGWMKSLFVGCYDDAHFERVTKIGMAHVRVGLPQHYMLTATNWVRTELIEKICRLKRQSSESKVQSPKSKVRGPKSRRSCIDNGPQTLDSELAAAMRSVNRILDLHLAVMLDAYRAEHSRNLRQAERASMERRLEEVSHLANVGELAASLAHEIKNPLAGISGAIQVIGTALERDDPRREIIAEILSQIERLDGTVRDLLIYARPKPPSRIPKNIGKVIQRTLRFLRQEPALRGIPVRIEGLDCDGSANIDEPQIEQVFSNLILNAAHACEQGGDVTVSLSSDRENVYIEVADAGQGMTRESVERAFEPFFTTKAKGTGLGLAICKRIVEAHRGRIAIDSVEGEGTQVRIQLPR